MVSLRLRVGGGGGRGCSHLVQLSRTWTEAARPRARGAGCGDQAGVPVPGSQPSEGEEVGLPASSTTGGSMAGGRACQGQGRTGHPRPTAQGPGTRTSRPQGRPRAARPEPASRCRPARCPWPGARPRLSSEPRSAVPSGPGLRGAASSAPHGPCSDPRRSGPGAADQLGVRGPPVSSQGAEGQRGPAQPLERRTGRRGTWGRAARPLPCGLGGAGVPGWRPSCGDREPCPPKQGARSSAPSPTPSGPGGQSGGVLCSDLRGPRLSSTPLPAPSQRRLLVGSLLALTCWAPTPGGRG